MRRPVALGLAGVAVASLALIAFANRVTLRVRWDLAHLETGDDKKRDAALADLASLGEPGVRALESVVFDRETADPEKPRGALRKAAFGTVWALVGGLSEVCDIPEIDDERLARYVAETRGLDGVERHQVFKLLRWRGKKGRRLSPTLTKAATDVMMMGADASNSLDACRFLVDCGPSESLPALQRAALTAREDLVRGEAVNGLAKFPDPGNVLVLRKALSDRYEYARIFAAIELLEQHGDRSGLAVLVSCLHGEGLSRLQPRLVPLLEGLGDRRLVECLVRAHDGTTFYMSEERREQCRHALSTITGATLGEGETWSGWWDAHRSAFPPQLDPETVTVENAR